MIIAIDASRAVKEQPTGTELYSARLIQYLAKIDTENTYYLYTPVEPSKEWRKLPENFQWKVIPLARFWTQLRLSWALFIDNPDLLFVPAHVLPLYLPKKTITTVHDIAFEVFPEAYSHFDRWYLRYSVNRAKNKALKIITPSDSTKRDLTRIYKIAKSKIEVIPLGYDRERGERPDEIGVAVKALAPFFLSLGRIELRKNTGRLIEAFVQFKKNNPELGHRLVLIGKSGYGSEQIDAIVDHLPESIQKLIIRPGYLTDNQVKGYMAVATAFIFPTLYEGFGIPLLEAMAMGLPIIASDNSSIPEVVDDAAILVDPESVKDISKAMTLLATTELTRKELAKKAKERAKQFSWEKMTEQTHQLILEVLNEK